MFLLYTIEFGFEPNIYTSEAAATDAAVHLSKMRAYRTTKIQVVEFVDQLAVYNSDGVTVHCGVTQGRYDIA